MDEEAEGRRRVEESRWGGARWSRGRRGRIEGLLNLLGMADAGVDARAALEREDVTEAVQSSRP